MPRYRFMAADARDYHSAHLGRVEPGDVRELPMPPDGNWRYVPATSSAPDQPSAGLAPEPDPDDASEEV